jgi:hypothetical protein
MKSTLYRGLKIVERIKVKNSNYEICKLETGSYTCNCPSWIFHKGEKVNCKHIINYLNQLESPTIKQVEVAITDLKQKGLYDSETETLIDNYLSEEHDRQRDYEMEKQQELQEHYLEEQRYSDYLEKHKYDKD